VQAVVAMLAEDAAFSMPPTATEPIVSPW